MQARPPHAQPGGPGPLQAAACVTPGYPRARSTRSSTETARPNARARGRRERAELALVVLVGAAARRARRRRTFFTPRTLPSRL